MHRVRYSPATRERFYRLREDCAAPAKLLSCAVPIETSPPVFPAAAAAAVHRRRQVVVTGLLLAAAAGLALLLLELRANRGALEALAGAACRGDAAAASQLRDYLHVVLALVPASTFAFAGYVAVLARRVRRDGVFPPSGMWTLRPVRSFTGAAARRCAVVMLLLSATLATLALLLTAIGLRMLALLNR
jgi:hypothetical protein